MPPSARPCLTGLSPNFGSRVALIFGLMKSPRKYWPYRGYANQAIRNSVSSSFVLHVHEWVSPSDILCSPSPTRPSWQQLRQYSLKLLPMSPSIQFYFYPPIFNLVAYNPSFCSLICAPNSQNTLSKAIANFPKPPAMMSKTGKLFG